MTAQTSTLDLLGNHHLVMSLSKPNRSQNIKINVLWNSDPTCNF